MKLSAYLKLSKKTVTQTAKELKINRQYLHAILLGKMVPGRKLAMRIKQWSENAVNYEDLWG